jgi:hypothetical protein
VTFVVKNSAGVTVSTATGAISKGQGSASIRTTGLASGSYSVTATFNPAAINPNFNSSVGSTTLKMK